MTERKIIGICGKIGAGKSTFVRYFKEKHGFRVVDQDQLFKDRVKNEPKYQNAVNNLFNEKIYSGTVCDIDKLIYNLYYDKNKAAQFRALNNMWLSPYIAREIADFDYQHLIIESAFMLQTPTMSLMDLIINITCSDDTSLSRTLERDHRRTVELTKFLVGVSQSLVNEPPMFTHIPVTNIVTDTDWDWKTYIDQMVEGFSDKPVNLDMA